MLLELRVENLLLIERAELKLGAGLNVLTGETGAGKTILTHALDLLLGGRSRAGIVRPGAGEAYVEGVFALPAELRAQRGELLPADAEEIVLARRVGADGRTRAYVNGRSAGVGDLRALGESLIAFYAQHEHRRLLLPAAQLRILDDFCGPAQETRLHACADTYAQTRALEAELERLHELDGSRERELDLIEHELAEIDAAEPEDGEPQRLAAARERLRGLDALRAAAGHGLEALRVESAETPGAIELLAGAAGRLDGVAGVDPALDALAARYRALALEAEDLAGCLRDYGDALEGEDGALESVEARLELLERLMRKHGGTIAAVLAHAERSRARAAELRGAEQALEATSARLHAARASLQGAVQALRKARRAAAKRLAGAVQEQLAALAMPDASFEVKLCEREPGPTGADSVELLIAPNPGVAPGALREVASGGELSRVMLALVTAQYAGASTASAARQTTEAQTTLVFDEVDAGIGGHTARAVGERLRELASSRQVICITHLPQIASLASRHFSVEKDTGTDLTRATVVELAEPDVLAELVRMLGAPASDASARRHARELRKAA